MHKIAPRTLLMLALIGMLSGLTTPAMAQEFTFVYPTKFVCGYQPGNVGPLATTPSASYPNLEPGSYATLVNILHNQLQRDSVQAWVVPEFFPATQVNDFPSLGAFEAFDVTCADITRRLGVLQGTVIEGWLLLFATADAFNVAPVYTFESQNFFYQNQFMQVTLAGTILGGVGTFPIPFFPPFTGQGPGGVGTPSPVLPIPGTPGDVVGAGSGGLGLGASIDIENVEPVKLNEPVQADSIRDLLRFINGSFG